MSALPFPELPLWVRKTLPEDAQALYKAAFEQGWNDFEANRHRYHLQPRIEVAQELAWNSLLTQYVRQKGVWQKRQKPKRSIYTFS